MFLISSDSWMDRVNMEFLDLRKKAVRINDSEMRNRTLTGESTVKQQVQRIPYIPSLNSNAALLIILSRISSPFDLGFPFFTSS